MPPTAMISALTALAGTAQRVSPGMLAVHDAAAETGSASTVGVKVGKGDGVAVAPGVGVAVGAPGGGGFTVSWKTAGAKPGAVARIVRSAGGSVNRMTLVFPLLPASA